MTRLRVAIAAFTLIELLVVIAILAILIAVMFPALARARASGQNAKCLSNLRQIALADAAYRNEYRGVAPRNRAELTEVAGDLPWVCPADPEKVMQYIYRQLNTPMGMQFSQLAATNRIDAMDRGATSFYIAVDPYVSLTPPRSPHGERFNAGYLDGRAGPRR